MYFYIYINNQAEILVNVIGKSRTIILNRPKALNSLNLGMVRSIKPLIQVHCLGYTIISSGWVIFFTKGSFLVREYRGDVFSFGGMFCSCFF